MRKIKKLQKRLSSTKKAVLTFINQTKKNYINMKKKIKKVWLSTALFSAVAVLTTSCNVTRKMTTESSYFQKGDTTCTIIVKTIETYDAQKKGATL